MKTGKKKRPTQKQAKLIKLISENLGNKGLTKSMYQMMKEAGYSESMARKQNPITESALVTEATEPFVEEMIKERNAAIQRMKKVRGKANYRDMTDAIDKLTKNIQLLSGGKTENVEHRVIHVPQRK